MYNSLVASGGATAGISGIGVHDITDYTIEEDSSPLSATYGQPLPQTAVSPSYLGPGFAQGRWLAASDATGVVTNQSIGGNSMVVMPFVVPAFQQFNQMAIQVDVGEANVSSRVGIYDASVGLPVHLIRDFGTIDMSSPGLRTTTALTTFCRLSAGTYWLAMVLDLNSTLRINRHYTDPTVRQRWLGTTTTALSNGYIQTTFAWDPISVAATSFNVGTTVTLSGVALGDEPYLAAPYDTQALQLTPRVSATDTIAISMYNPTGSAIDLGNSANWVVGARKVNGSDFHLSASTVSGAVAALPAVFPTTTRSSGLTDPHLLIRLT